MKTHHGRFAVGFACQPPGLLDEQEAADGGAGEVDRAKAEGQRQQGSGNQRQGAEEDGVRCPLVTDDDRQHGYAGGFIIGAESDRQAPEMRRRPQKEHQCQRQRHAARLRVGGGRPRQYRPTPGQTAEDDVQPAPPLQPHRINDGVEEGAEKDEQRRPGVEGEPGAADRQRHQGADDQQPDRPMAEFAGDEGALAGTRHQVIAVVFVILVEGAGAGRRNQHRQGQHQQLQQAQGRPRADRKSGQRGEGDDDADAQLEDAQNGTEGKTGGAVRWECGLHWRR